MTHHPSRRSFLRQVAAGVPALPIAAGIRLPQDLDDWEGVRAQFAFRESMVPMNAGNLCPPPRPVADRLVELTREIDADVSYGGRAKFATLLEDSRAAVAAHLGVTPDEIALVRNTTEANATVIAGLPLAAGDEVVVWDQNHPTNGVAWDVAAARAGLTVTRVSTPPRPRDPGELVDPFVAALGPRTRVLALTHVANFSGIRLPVEAICERARARGVHVHVDGAQSWGAVRVDLRAIGCDTYSASCHKWLCGPKESGILFVRADRVEDVWPHTVGFGWGSGVAPDVVGARKFESLGQRDDACLAAVGTTIDFHQAIGVDRIEARMYELVGALKEGLRSAGVPLETIDAPEMTAGVCLVPVAPARRREVLGRLEREHGIAASPAGGLRLCPHLYNTMEHVERAVAGVAALRRLLA